MNSIKNLCIHVTSAVCTNQNHTHQEYFKDSGGVVLIHLAVSKRSAFGFIP